MSEIGVKKIKLFIFDWDGTLANSIDTIASCLIDAFKECNFGELEYEKATSIIGLPLVKALEVLSPGITPENHELLLKTYKKYFMERISRDSLLYSGARELLELLHEKGYLMAVATGKSRAGLERDLDATNIRHVLQSTKTIDECLPKPNPHMIETILNELGVSPEEALMIGDTSYDLEMAQNAGIASLGVFYGAHPKDKLTPFYPLELFKDFKSLSDYIRDCFAPAAHPDLK